MSRPAGIARRRTFSLIPWAWCCRNIVLVILVLWGCGWTGCTPTPETSALPPAVEIEIWQGGQPVAQQNGNWALRKAPFTMYLHLIRTPGMYVSISFASSMYLMPDSAGIEYLDAKVLPEQGENRERGFYVDAESFHYWCSCPEDESPYFFNKFNSVRQHGDTLTGERIIEHIYSPEEIAFSDMDRDLYVVVLLMRHAQHTPVEELHRQRYRIHWE